MDDFSFVIRHASHSDAVIRHPPMKPPPRTARPRSLFARLLIAQSLLALALTALLAGLFYGERNRTVAQLVAERWAPALREAAGLAPAVASEPAGAVLRSQGRPANAVWAPTAVPRLAALRDALRTEGITVHDMALVRDADAPTLWMAVAAPGGEPRWLGFSGELIEPRLRDRLALALVLGMVLVVALAAYVTRRLTRPLERLRERMDAFGVLEQAATPADPAPSGTSSEVAAIDAAFAHLRTRLERQERERALLLAGVSHDLRSPLARIRIAAGLLPDAAGVAPRREAIERNAALADRLVQSFLDHVRSGELALDQTVDIAAQARAVVQRQMRSADELRLEAPASVVLAQAHPLLIERALSNLLDNAFNHGQAPVTLRVIDARTHVSLEVQDRGAGIAPEAREAMQQAFARGDASRSRPGLGLGLAVVQRVVQRLGGHIEFEREAAKGDAPPRHVVRVVLPR
jgi:two-component system, OmpR family, osmolarity sensor histidine kinase EnvZ